MSILKQDQCDKTTYKHHCPHENTNTHIHTDITVVFIVIKVSLVDIRVWVDIRVYQFIANEIKIYEPRSSKIILKKMYPLTISNPEFSIFLVNHFSSRRRYQFSYKGPYGDISLNYPL